MNPDFFIAVIGNRAQSWRFVIHVIAPAHALLSSFVHEHQTLTSALVVFLVGQPFTQVASLPPPLVARSCHLSTAPRCPSWRWEPPAGGIRLRAVAASRQVGDFNLAQSPSRPGPGATPGELHDPAGLRPGGHIGPGTPALPPASGS